VPDAETMIANRALQKLGASRVMSMGDDTKNGRACHACYAALRDAELRAHGWKFATARATLAELDEAPAWGFAHQFEAPADCLRLLQVGESPAGDSLADYRSAPQPVFAYEGGRILTNLSAPLNIRYVRRVTDVSRFDPLFSEALAARMAVELADELTDSPSKASVAQGMYKDAIRQAVRVDAIERGAETSADASWMTGRL
jgi:hypothetical protein